MVQPAVAGSMMLTKGEKRAGFADTLLSETTLVYEPRLERSLRASRSRCVSED